MRLETMTEVQSATLNEALKGTDIIAQAKTGTGKTVAFLLPVLQNIIKEDPHLAESFRGGRRGPRTTADDIRALIISPTRELAEQIAEEAKKMCRNTSIIVQTAVGGTQKRAGMRAIQREGCHILVGTPGRLQDILSDPDSRVEAPDLSALVFDEADRLLDQGFWPDIQEIMKLLPSPAEKDRQTLMFSATIPKDVVTLARSTLKKGFQFVRTIRDDEQPTHERVPQHLVVCNSFENMLPSLIELCDREINAAKEDPSKPPFKAMVYFNGTAEVSLAHSILTNLDAEDGEVKRRFIKNLLEPARLFQIHARLTQAQRTRAAENFRNCRSGIFLTSDVTARGMDFPGVTHVIQMGLPTSKEMYIHRIGRTARAGREGEGHLILTKLETRELEYKLSDMPLKRTDDLKAASLDLSQAADLPEDLGRILSKYQDAVKQVPRAEKVKAYLSMFGSFNWFPRKQALVDGMNRLSLYGWGMPDVPLVSPALIRALGLRNVAGLRVGHEDRDDDRDDARFGRRDGPSGGMRTVGPRFGRRSFEEGDDRFQERRSSYDRGSGSRFGRSRDDSYGGGFDRGSRGGDRRSGGFGGDRSYGRRDRAASAFD